ESGKGEGGMMGRLDGKVVIITGGGSGIGAARARLFVTEGARDGICDLERGEVNAVVYELTARGGEALGMVADVSNSEQVKTFVDAVIDRFGRLDGLFSNAGISGRGNVVELDEVDFNRTIAVNLGGAFLCCKHAIPHLARSGGGS